MKVVFKSCPKCAKRLRIELSTKTAYVNLARLGTYSAAQMKARALRLLSEGLKSLPVKRALMPLMGWSSWNTFGVEISDKLILETARSMVKTGLAKAGYNYVNIDDGFFWGHGPDGKLRFNPYRFPRGMKPVVEGIHKLGLKAGIYSDVGTNTCGSFFGGGSTPKDEGGRGGGLLGHDKADCDLHFKELKFDFFKVDFCGGRELKLDTKKRYLEVARAVRATGRRDVRINICRWAFPGTWAAKIAGSWRTTEDIRASWPSVKSIIDENLYLSAYSSPGHYNDMDMLEVGQRLGAVKSAFDGHGDLGLTEDEETAHFGMWCMMSSPLLIGCDVRNLPEFTKRLITNPYLLKVNQNSLGLSAYVAETAGEVKVLVKDAERRFGKSRYVAAYNPGDGEATITLHARALDLGGKIAAFDLVEMADVGEFADEVTLKLKPHSARFFKFDAERRLPRESYPAETAYLNDYQALRDPTLAGTAFVDKLDGATNGVAVRYLGGRASNYLCWSELEARTSGDYLLTIRYSSPNAREIMVTIDKRPAKTIKVVTTKGGWAELKLKVKLAKGLHSVKLGNPKAWAPDIDGLIMVKL